MTYIKITVLIPDGNRNEFEQTVQWMLAKNHAGSGPAPRRTVYQDLAKPNHFFYFEELTVAEKPETRMKEEEFKALLGAMEVLGEIVDAKVISGASEEEMALTGMEENQ